MLPMFLGSVDQTLLATATPRIGAELGRLSDTSWIAIGYLLAATVMAPVYGRLGDRYGRRNALLAALCIFAAGSIVCATAVNLPMLIAARSVQGLGGGGLMVMSQALIGELVPPRLRPAYQGYFALVFTCSSIGGPLLGGFVVNHASWRWLFLVNLPLCAFAAWRVTRLPHSSTTLPTPLQHPPLDRIGVLLFALTACSGLLWFSLGGHRFAWLSATSAALLLFALTAGSLLAWQQRRQTSPFLPLDVLRLPGVRWSCLSVMCFASGLFALIFLLPIYAQVGHGSSAAGAGLQLLPLTAGMVVGSALNGRIAAWTGIVGRTPRWGLGAASLALLALALAPSSPTTTMCAAAVCGLGFGMVMPNAQITTQMRAGRERLGAAAALLALTRSSGAALGTAVFSGLAFALLSTAPGPRGTGAAFGAVAPAEVAQAFHIVFGALAACMALGAWCATRMPVLALAGDETA